MQERLEAVAKRADECSSRVDSLQMHVDARFEELGAMLTALSEQLLNGGGAPRERVESGGSDKDSLHSDRPLTPQDKKRLSGYLSGGS